MRICLIGKYPPIEGGVSAHTYWLARGLAERGHEVHVVTNADEVEDDFRMHFEEQDGDWMQPSFPGGGRVRLYEPAPLDQRAMGHIPQANPFVTKLASLATDVIRRHACDLVLAYYFEPYGMAGWLASRWTGRPLIVKHAGSDLDRLMNVPDLATAYRELLRSADAVVTQPGLLARFEGLGVDPSRLAVDVMFNVPRAFFNGAAVPRARPSAAATVVGVYGKIGLSKGSFDLVAALGRLAAQGVDVSLAAMVGASQGRHLQTALEQAGLRERTAILPMVPNWRVPGFLRACDAVCFLERDFPVAVHGPIVPREILACGTCLVLSGEIASKQRYRDRLVDGRNVVLIDDPRNHDALAAALRRIAQEPSRAREIGRQGELLSRSLEDHAAFVGRWEELIERVAGQRRSLGSTACARPDVDPAGAAPALFDYLHRIWPDLLTGLHPSPDSRGAQQAALDLLRGAEARLRERARGGEPTAPAARAADLVAYACERLAARCQPDDAPAAFPVQDRLKRGPFSLDTVAMLRPVRGTSLRVVEFLHDVTASRCLDSVGSAAVATEPVVDDLPEITAGPVLVAFHRSPALVPCELRIDRATRALLALCDGSRTTTDIVAELCRLFGARSASAQADVAAKATGALRRLHGAGTIVFGEFRPGWGWMGGDRVGRADLTPDSIAAELPVLGG